MTQTGKINIIVIIAIMVVAIGVSAFVMFKFVLGGNGESEPKEEKPCEKAYLEMDAFQQLAVNPTGPQRAIVQLSLLFEHCVDDKLVPTELERVMPLLKADISFYLQSQTLEDFGVENRTMLEEELRILINQHLEKTEKGLTSVRVTDIVVQYM